MEVRGGDEADEDAVTDDGETAVDFACVVEEFEFATEALGGDEGRGGNVDDAMRADFWGDVSEVGGEYWADFVVEQGVRVHVREEVVDAERLDGIGGPFGYQD